MGKSRLAWGGVLLLSLATLGCQWISDLIPSLASPLTSPSPSPSASPGAVVPLTIPVILPKPAPTPTPAPAPTPAPTPTPPPPPPQSNCSLPPSNPPSYSCFAEQTQFLGVLDAAITAVTQQNPELFDFNKANCEGCYYIKDANRYHAEVGRQLAQRGYCTFYDGVEIGIKNNNAFNEQFDIYLAAGYIRRGRGTYMGTCRPAWF